MAFIILEGLDRTGKSSVAEAYKAKGYHVHHMSAPDKKYTQPGYSGPSYLDEMLELLMGFNGQDVVFDRSWYGESVWPHVYGRQPMLTEEDIEVLQEFEYRNNTERYLMTDPDTQAHWKRCVDNNEPLNISQFKIATSLFAKMAHKYGFMPSQLKDFPDATKTAQTKDTPQTSSAGQQEAVQPQGQSKTAPASTESKASDIPGANPAQLPKKEETTNDLIKNIERANAIRSILSSRVLKKTGGAFEDLEGRIKNFLENELKEIFNKPEEPASFTPKEVELLKILCRKLEEKDKGLSR